jgi:hypothetical protein
MDIVNRLPDEVVNAIMLYLSTPTADLIKRDFAEQFRKYTCDADGDIEEWHRLYGRIRFAEIRWFQIMRMFKRIGPLTITWGSQLRFVRDLLCTQNVNVSMIQDDSDDDQEEEDSDMSDGEINFPEL